MGMGELFQALLSLIFVLGLIGIAAVLAKKYGLDGMGLRKTMGSKRRLSIEEIRMLDPKRKLVLIRRDNVEHLLLVGGERPVIIESGIACSVVSSETVPLRVEEVQSDGQ
ncbi:MAG: hypothetical protein K0R63_1591 [Rickettsiales bacterium]|jgi:flagellar protein FliO/FliZ|nr:hypothetical protein [Rickettsiales bacterium]